jgi:hypothetical protein
MKAVSAIAALAALTAACTTVTVPAVIGGPPMSLTPEVAADLSVRHIRIDADDWIYFDYREARDPDSNDWRDFEREMEFKSTVEDELREELNLCATGARPVDMTVRVTSMEADPRLRSLLDGNGADTLGAIVEMVDPAGGRVLGRYAMRVGARSGNVLDRIAGDSLMNTAEMMGRELCLQAFGRNPRPSSWRNATSG